MENEYIKLFLDRENKQVISVKYSPEKNEYYSIIRENHKKGYGQIIITSEMMVKIICEYFFNRQFVIQSIEFMDEDELLQTEINKGLSKLNSNRAYIVVFLNKIRFILEVLGEDIKIIQLVDKNTTLFINVNGVIEINAPNPIQELQNIVSILHDSII